MNIQGYEVDDSEARQIQEIIDRIKRDGDLRRVDRFGDYVLDGEGQFVPIAWEPLRSKRFIVDRRGTLWRFFAKNTPKRPDGTGMPRRTDAIEIWTGHWRKRMDGGQARYIKNTICVPVEKGVNQKQGISHIDYYTQSKGFKHPHAKPDAPTQTQMQALDRKCAETAGLIYAKAQEQGLDPGKTQKAIDASGTGASAAPVETPKRKRRTNRKATDAA